MQRYHWATSCLVALALAAGAPHPAQALPRIMIVGDSLLSGTGLKRAGNHATHRLQKQSGVIVHNFTSPGARMADLPFFAGMNQAGKAVRLVSGFFGMRGVLVALGTNDWGQGIALADFTSSYANFLADLPVTLAVACLSPPWRRSDGEPNANGDTLDDFRAAVRDVCTAAGHAYLDGKAAIPNSLAYFPDGLHPNDRGDRAMASFLFRELRILGWFS